MTNFGSGPRRSALVRLNLSTDPCRPRHRTDAQGRATADGVFLPSGTFRVLPPLPEALRHKLLDFLCTEGVLDAELAQRMLKWRQFALGLRTPDLTDAIEFPILCSEFKIV
jgi:hypothetical protein